MLHARLMPAERNYHQFSIHSITQCKRDLVMHYLLSNENTTRGCVTGRDSHERNGKLSTVAFTGSHQEGTISCIEVLQDHSGLSPRQRAMKPTAKNEGNADYFLFQGALQRNEVPKLFKQILSHIRGEGEIGVKFPRFPGIVVHKEMGNTISPHFYSCPPCMHG